MALTREQEQLIARIYYDKRTGFKTVRETTRRVREEDSTISREEVASWLAKQEVRQQRAPRATNSYVPEQPRQQFQMDLADWGFKARPRYALVAIDMFTKKLSGQPMADKSGPTTFEAFKEVLD